MSKQMYYDEEAGQFFPIPDAVEQKFITNADRIRAMSDEELADEILRWFNWLNAVEWNDKRILDWMKQEVKE